MKLSKTLVIVVTSDQMASAMIGKSKNGEMVPYADLAGPWTERFK